MFSNCGEANRSWGGTRADDTAWSAQLCPVGTVTAGSTVSSSSRTKATAVPAGASGQGRREAARLNMKASKTKGV